jgi:hypothetical protein
MSGFADESGRTQPAEAQHPHVYCAEYNIRRNMLRYSNPRPF